jgi:flavin-dependent dehydrogenase
LRQVPRTTKNPRSFDVIVAGSGVAAVASALSLLKLGRSVAILERPSPAKGPVGETLSPRCNQILSELGLLGDFLAQNPLASTSVRVAWNRPHLEEQDYSFHPCGPWWHVDHAAFRKLLLCAARNSGACLVSSSDIDLVRANHREWAVEVVGSDGERRSMRSRVLVDATGRSAFFARKYGARRERYDNLMAISGVTHCAARITPDQIFTLIEAVSDGWWYSSFASGHTFVATFMTDGPLPAVPLKSIWTRQLGISQFTRSRLRSPAEAGRVFCLSAATLKTEPLATQALFTVGDAALACDPLSSQGIQRALTSGIAAGTAIDDTLRGKVSAAADYARGLEADFERYLTLRSSYYSRVSRFRDSTFWNARSEASDGATKAVCNRNRKS